MRPISHSLRFWYYYSYDRSATSFGVGDWSISVNATPRLEIFLQYCNRIQYTLQLLLQDQLYNTEIE